MKRHGFTLIECLISITLFTLIALLATHFALKSYASLHTLRTQGNNCMMHNAAFDLLLYDVKRAPKIATWLPTDKANKYAWRQEKDSITWYLKGDALMRKTGKRSSMVAYNISSLKIVKNKEGLLVSLSCKGNENESDRLEQIVRVIQ